MRRLIFSALLLTSGIAGCGDRAEVWDGPAPNTDLPIYGMKSTIALLDNEAERVVFATPETVDQMSFAEVTTGRGYQTSAVTSDKQKLVTLTAGDVPRRKAEDQGPALRVFDTATSPPTQTVFELADPLSGLVLDPRMEFGVIYPRGASVAFVQNPNELVLVRLNEPPSENNPLPATIRSYGGRPEGFTFTDELLLPGGARRLLVVRTDRDVALIDLNQPEKPEITVKLTTGATQLVPAGIAASDGEPEDENDARVAVRLANDNSVILLDLLPTPADKVDTSPHSFSPVPNIVDVGGVPSDITFAKTDGGLRLLALVPSEKALKLVDPTTGVATSIALGAPFEKMSLVTNVVGPTEAGSDVALLWSGNVAGVAFVALGSTIGKPYKSVEVRPIDFPAYQVLDVPAPNSHLKVLMGSQLSILDLLTRTITPFITSQSPNAFVSDDGQRLWISARGYEFAKVDLTTKHPQNYFLNQNIDDAMEVERADGGQAFISIRRQGALSLSMFDAMAPSLEQNMEYFGILYGDYSQEGDQ